MPELPDIETYIECLKPRVLHRPILKVRLASPFFLRTASPPLGLAEGRSVRELKRLGKRIVFTLEEELFLVLHLMIAGRLHWKECGAALPARRGLAAFDFPDGCLTVTEAGSKRRAGLFLAQGEDQLGLHDPGGLEVLTADLHAFRRSLLRENHTLKRALTDPRIFSGIGNAYSDEILHCARLSPLKQTVHLSESEIQSLYEATRQTLLLWKKRLLDETGDRFPEKVTAFREGMAVHGRFRQPCPTCGSPVQRIVYADRETNYCPPCQTAGRLLADRALSRLLKKDWPRNLEDLEEMRRRPGTQPETGK